MSEWAKYLAVFSTFMRNSLVREMTFRSHFIIESIAALSWPLMNLGFYKLIFLYTREIGANTGWGEFEFYAFLSTTMIVNSMVQAFFMPNCEEFSEMIRTGGLDFALLKPIDTQFLVSLQRVSWSSLTNLLLGLGLLAVSVYTLRTRASDPIEIPLWTTIAYPIYVLCGVMILYSLMIALSAMSIWMGRNQSLYDFWFYITNFSRYPMEIYSGRWGTPLRIGFTFIIPVLVVINVPARLLVQPLRGENFWLALFTLLATAAALGTSRWIFQLALQRYRSASS
ncbi:MAG: ABC transporter permease [Planctomycetes bacterium]|nr:ABC transporter permease [Planctomycetota bacterium]